MEDMKKFELNDEALDTVAGGYEIGQTVHFRNDKIEYCPKCGKLLTNYEATITGVRGVLDGNTVYWINRGCCGSKTSESEIMIIG